MWAQSKNENTVDVNIKSSYIENRTAETAESVFTPSEGCIFLLFLSELFLGLVVSVTCGEGCVFLSFLKELFLCLVGSAISQFFI